MSHPISELNEFQGLSSSPSSETSQSVLSIRQKFESNAEGTTNLKTDSVGCSGFHPMIRSSVIKPKSNIDKQHFNDSEKCDTYDINLVTKEQQSGTKLEPTPHAKTEETPIDEDNKEKD